MKNLFKKGSGSTGFGAILALIMVPTLIVVILMSCYAVKDIQTKEELRQQESVEFTPTETPNTEISDVDREQIQEDIDNTINTMFLIRLFKKDPLALLWLTQNGNSIFPPATTEPPVQETVPEVTMPDGICDNCNTACDTPYCSQCGAKQ